MRRDISLIAVVAAACFAAAGCENTASGIKKDAQENAAAAKEGTAEARAESKEAGAEAKAEGKEVGADIKEAASDAGNAVAGAAEKAAPAIDAAKQTLDVKTALMADAAIDASKIDVDTDAATKTVTLKGSVPSAAQKTSAERIAHAKAGGYKVNNQLVVTGR
jgi:hyperosmotically inducible periplasmic protein